MTYVTPTSGSIGFFKEHGYAFIKDYLSPDDCRVILDSIQEFRRTRSLIEVNRSSIIELKHFLTINGNDVEEHIDRGKDLYLDVNQFINKTSQIEYVPVDSKEIGLSINITPPGGQFSWHYDRNEVTVVLYLNGVDGGEMEFYPRYRFLLKNRHRGIRKWTQRIFDATIRPKVMRNI